MRLHVIEDELCFPLLVEDLDDGDSVCLDSPTMHNLEIGDQIQCFPELETWIYIVVDVTPAKSPLDGYKYVTLRNVYCSDY